MRKNKKPIVNKIDFDEKTAEPIIVEVSDKELMEKIEQEEKAKIQKADFFEVHKNPKEAGKQIMMKHLGMTSKEDETISKRQRIIKTIISTIFIAFVVGVLAFTIYNDFVVRDNEFLSWGEIGDILSVGWIYLLGAIICLALCYFLKALKLSIFCKQLTGKFHFKTCFETAIIGHYYNFVTPLAVGGQPFEIYHLSNHGIHGGVASSLPLATYVLNQFAFVIMGVIFLIMFKNDTLGINPILLSGFDRVLLVLAIVGLSLSMLMPVLIIIFALSPRLGAKIIGLVMRIGGKLRIIKDPKKATYKTVKNLIRNAQCIKRMVRRPFTPIVNFLLSFLEHFAYLSIAYFSLKIFNFDSHMAQPNFFLEWLQIAELVLILNCAISFIPTPGNAGAADLSFYLLFTAGLAGGLAFPAMTVWRLLAFYSYIIIGFIFATLKKRSDKRKERKNQLSNE